MKRSLSEVANFAYPPILQPILDKISRSIKINLKSATTLGQTGPKAIAKCSDDKTTSFESRSPLRRPPISDPIGSTSHLCVTILAILGIFLGYRGG